MQSLDNIQVLIQSKLSVANITADFISAHHLIVIVDKEHIIKTLTALKKSDDLQFTILTEVFAADFPDRDRRFEVVYSLLSITQNARIMVKVHIAENESLQSSTIVFSAANWYEREIYDLFGIKFTDHPYLRRILTDYGFVGYPLRKDFALSGYTQVRYDDKLEKVIYEPVQLEQEYRNFDFLSPWHGPDKNKSKT